MFDASAVSLLAETLGSPESAQLWDIDVKESPMVALALLSYYEREPLIPFDDFDDIQSSTETADAFMLSLTIKNLPVSNRDSLCQLVLFLKELSSTRESYTRYSLSRIFGPIVCRPEDPMDEDLDADWPLISGEMMIMLMEEPEKYFDQEAVLVCVRKKPDEGVLKNQAENASTGESESGGTISASENEDGKTTKSTNTGKGNTVQGSSEQRNENKKGLELGLNLSQEVTDEGANLDKNPALSPRSHQRRLDMVVDGWFQDEPDGALGYRALSPQGGGSGSGSGSGSPAGSGSPSHSHSHSPASTPTQSARTPNPSRKRKKKKVLQQRPEKVFLDGLWIERRGNPLFENRWLKKYIARHKQDPNESKLGISAATHLKKRHASRAKVSRSNSSSPGSNSRDGSFASSTSALSQSHRRLQSSLSAPQPLQKKVNPLYSARAVASRQKRQKSEKQVSRALSSWYGKDWDRRVETEKRETSVVDLSRRGMSVLYPWVFKLPCLEVLNVYANRLVGLDEEIGKLHSLTALGLNENMIKELPPQIGQLRALRILDLRHNRLRALPDQISNLVFLQRLFLRFNKLKSLPAGLGALTRLEIFSARNNAIAALPEKLQWPNLKVLDMQHNQLVSVPDLCLLTNLSCLDIQHNKCAVFPSGLECCTKLTRLSLGYNKLTSCVDILGNLLMLRELDLESNQLVGVPSSIGKLELLETLYLSRNRLEKLPEEIGNLVSLKELHVGGNVLTEVPDLTKCTSLRECDFSGNELIHFPTLMPPSLRVLSLNDNEIAEWPSEEALRPCCGIKILNMEENALVDLGESVCRSLSNLKELRLQYNEIKVISPYLGSLVALETLLIDMNQVSELPREIGRCQALVTLSVADNELLDLPSELVRLKTLHFLRVENNPLSELSSEPVATGGRAFELLSKRYLDARRRERKERK